MGGRGEMTGKREESPWGKEKKSHLQAWCAISNFVLYSFAGKKKFLKLFNDPHVMILYLVSTFFCSVYYYRHYYFRITKTMRSWGSVIPPSYRGGGQSHTSHEWNTLTLLTSEGWNEEMSTGWAAGAQMSEQRAMCRSEPSKLCSGLSQHILQRITITLFCTDSPFQLCCVTTYWQSREREKKKSGQIYT